MKPLELQYNDALVVANNTSFWRKKIVTACGTHHAQKQELSSYVFMEQNQCLYTHIWDETYSRNLTLV